jgi:hypothetical protein
MKSRTTQGIKAALIALLAVGWLTFGWTLAHATSVDAISGNINAMRQLPPSNIVQRLPGAAPYYGPSICQQQLPAIEASLTSFDPAYTCTCSDPKKPPVCQGPAHYATATTTCAPETPFGSGVAPPLGGPNPQPQDWAVNQATVGVGCSTTCDRYSNCTTTCNPGMGCQYPANSTASVSSAPVSCASLGLTTTWLQQYAQWGVYQYASYSRYGGSTGVTGYANVCVAALAPVGTPAPSGWPAPTASNPLPWPYTMVPCNYVGIPVSTTVASAQTCQVFQTSCSPTWLEGYATYATWGATASITSLTGGGLSPNFAPAGYPGWQGPFMTQSRGSDGCAARYACTGSPQSSIPIEMSCWGSYNNGLGSTGFGTMGSASIPNGGSGGTYPDYNSTTTYAGPTASAAWGCNGNGGPVPSNVVVTCSGAVCTYSMVITPSGSCQNHIPVIQWNMYRDDYLPICPAGTSYKPALNLCTN